MNRIPAGEFEGRALHRTISRKASCGAPGTFQMDSQAASFPIRIRRINRRLLPTACGRRPICWSGDGGSWHGGPSFKSLRPGGRGSPQHCRLLQNIRCRCWRARLASGKDVIRPSSAARESRDRRPRRPRPPAKSLLAPAAVCTTAARKGAMGHRPSPSTIKPATLVEFFSDPR